MKKFFFFFFLLNHILFAQFQHFVNRSYIGDLSFVNTISQSEVVIGSSGGLVFLDISNLQYKIANLTNDLTLTHCTSGALLNDHLYVAGDQSGNIAVFDLSSFTLADHNSILKNEEIKSFFIKTDTVWVATSKRIALFVWKNEKLKFLDSYSNFPGQIESIQKIQLSFSKVYVQTNEGIIFAPSDVQTFNLKDEKLWAFVKDSLSLPLENVKDILSKNDTLFIATNSGLYVFMERTSQVHQILNTNASRIKYFQQLWFLNKNLVQNYLSTESYIFPKNLIDFSVLPGSVVGITSNGKVYLYSSGSLDSLYLLDFPMKIAGEIIKSKNGNYYTNGSPPPFYVDNGLVRWNDKMTTHYYWNGIKWFNRTRFVSEIQPGLIMTGTWGAGFWLIDEENGKIITMNNFDESISYNVSVTEISASAQVVEKIIPKDSIERLPSVLSPGMGFESDNLVFIADAIMDSLHGYLWVLQYIPSNHKNLIGFPVVDGKVQWSGDNILQIQIPGVTQDAIYSMTIDFWGNIWLGTPFNGVYIFNFDSYLAGEKYLQNFVETDGLASNNVLSLATDLDGYVWIGTASGTNVWTGSQLIKLREEYQPIGLQINNIYIDEVGNRWFATDVGVSLHKSSAAPWDPTGWFHYVAPGFTLSRDHVNYVNIPQNDFYGVFVDYSTLTIYLGSQNGLLYSNHFSGISSKSSQEKIVAFPNPAILKDDNTLIKIKNVLPSSTIKIINLSGEFIRELNPNDPNEFNAYWGIWDGKDERGNPVSSGVYLIVAINEYGKSQKGKIFLIRK